MDRKGHISLDKILFNKEFNEVHKWLDSTYLKYANTAIPHMHWLMYHHKAAIKEKYGSFTLEYNAAYTHILTDFLYHFKMAYVPEDMTDLIDTFISLGVIKRDYKYK